MTLIKPYTWFLLGIFICWFVYSLYLGIVTPPSEGDSLLIHIHQAHKILDGSIFNLNFAKDLFYPAATELFLAVFIALKIPLGLFNVLGIGTLFLGSVLLGKELFKDLNYSVAFAVSISLMHGVIRWSLTQKPDILMLASLSFILWVLFKKKRVLGDYLLLGIFAGIFAGAKFNGPVFLFVILLPFYKIFLNEFAWKKVLFFLLPFSLLALPWYIRNIIITGDPFYFPDYRNILTSGSFNYAIKSYFVDSVSIVNAYLSEFMIWSLSIIAVPLYALIERNRLKLNADSKMLPLLIGGVGLFLVSLGFPYWKLYDQLVFTMRYLLPMIYLFVLCTFLIFKKHKLENLLILIIVPVILVSLMQDYHPKIMIPFIILSWIIYFWKRILRVIIR